MISPQFERCVAGTRVNAAMKPGNCTGDLDRYEFPVTARSDVPFLASKRGYEQFACGPVQGIAEPRLLARKGTSLRAVTGNS